MVKSTRAGNAASSSTTRSCPSTMALLMGCVITRGHYQGQVAADEGMREHTLKVLAEEKAKAAPGQCIDKNEQYLGHAPAKSADASVETQNPLATVDVGGKYGGTGNMGETDDGGSAT